MTYRTILTSKGTTTIPKEIRDQLGVKPGMYISFTKSPLTGEYTIKRTPSIQEVRCMNSKALKKAGTLGKEYKSGDGFGEFIAEKYGR